jgi:hypothetical protein
MELKHIAGTYHIAQEGMHEYYPMEIWPTMVCIQTLLVFFHCGRSIEEG